MKRTYILTVAILFLSSMFLLFSGTHVFDERPTQAVFRESRAEQIPVTSALLSPPLERLYHLIFDQFAP